MGLCSVSIHYLIRPRLQKPHFIIRMITRDIRTLLNIIVIAQNDVDACNARVNWRPVTSIPNAKDFFFNSRRTPKTTLLLYRTVIPRITMRIYTFWRAVIIVLRFSHRPQIDAANCLTYNITTIVLIYIYCFFFFFFRTV